MVASRTCRKNVAAEGKDTSRSSSWQGLLFIIRAHPMTVVIPFLVFAVGVVVGVFVIRMTEEARQQAHRTSTQNVALQAAQSIQLQLASLLEPVIAMRVFLRRGIFNYTQIQEIFPSMAADLLSITAHGECPSGLKPQLQLAPQAVIQDIYPLNDDTKSGLGLDLLAIKGKRNNTLNTMRHGKINVAVVQFVEGPLALLTSCAIFIDNVPRNQSFNQLVPVSPWCPPDLCYQNQTQSKFWGLAMGAFLLDALLLDPAGPVQQLVAQGFHYRLVQLPSATLPPTEGYGAYTLLSRSAGEAVEPEEVVISLSDEFMGFVQWELYVSPEGGWTSCVAKAMYAVVVIVSATIAVLLSALLISRVQNRTLLLSLIPAHVADNLNSYHKYYTGLPADNELATRTPAEVMLELLAKCLEGELPGMSTVVQLRAALLSVQDLYRPADVTQAVAELGMDNDVAGALIQQLQGRVKSSLGAPLEKVQDLEPGGAALHDDLTGGISLQEVLATFVLGKTHAALQKGKSIDKLQCGASRCSSGRLAPGSGDFIIEAIRASGGGSPSSGAHSLSSFRDASAHRSTAGPLAEPIWSEIHVLLEAGWSSWTWDAFSLDTLTQGHSLSTLAFFLLHRSGLIQQLNLPQAKIARFLTALESSYVDTPYHNRTHAADVLQTMHVIISRGGLVPGYVDPIRQLACLLAAAAHDVDHTGLTNDFLINTEAPLAIRYSDQSPMEKHHLATLFTLLKQPGNDFTRGLPKESRDLMRKVIIELVLGTDMKQHMTITSQFKSVHQQLQAARGEDAPSASTPLTPLDDAEQLLSLQMALKVADLGSLAESHEVNIRWVDVLEEEFFRQGDQERALGMPISPLFDRYKPGAAKCQVGFFSFVGLPLFNAFVQVFSSTKPFLDAAEANFRYWKSVSPAPRNSLDVPAESVSKPKSLRASMDMDLPTRPSQASRMGSIIRSISTRRPAAEQPQPAALTSVNDQ